VPPRPWQLVGGTVEVAKPDQHAREVEPGDPDVPHLSSSFLGVGNRGKHLGPMPQISLLRGGSQRHTRLRDAPLSGAEVLVEGRERVPLRFRIDSGQRHGCGEIQ
jgi:hypothetical protein